MNFSKLKSYRTLEIVTFCLVISIFASLFVVGIYNAEVSAKNPYTIGVSISGPSKLGVGEVGHYTANILNASSGARLAYEWKINPTGNVTFSPNGAGCDLTFNAATEEPYLISVQVQDVLGHGYGYAVKIVYDPYTSPNLYLGSTGASYSWLIETDGLGWYRAVNGQTGAISYASTDASAVIENAAHTGKNLFFKNGIYELATTVDLSDIQGLTLRGETPEAGSVPIATGVVFRYSGTVTNDIMFNVDNSAWNPQNTPTKMTFKNIQIDGNAKNGKTVSGIYGKNVGALNIEGSMIHSCLNYGIYLNNSMWLNIANSFFGGGDNTNVHTTTAITNGAWFPNGDSIFLDFAYTTKITDNAIGAALRNGIFFNGGENLVITNNYIGWNGYGAQGTGVNLTKSYSFLQYVSIENNIVDENGLYGLYGYGSIHGLRILDNQFISNGRFKGESTPYGVYLTGLPSGEGNLTNIDFIGNTVEDPLYLYSGQNSLYLHYVNGSTVSLSYFNKSPSFGEHSQIIYSHIRDPLVTVHMDG